MAKEALPCSIKRSSLRLSTLRVSCQPRVPGGDYGVLDELLGYAIRRAQIKVYAHFFKSIGDQTTTPQRFTVLSIIGSNPGLQQKEVRPPLKIQQLRKGVQSATKRRVDCP